MHVSGPEYDPTTDANRIVSGKVTVRFTNVSKPTLAIYLADPGKNTHVAAVVFPGGGYDHLAYNIEGTEVCAWLNSIGVNWLAILWAMARASSSVDGPQNMVTCGSNSIASSFVASRLIVERSEMASG